jgi:hypothetical protein
VIKTRERRIVMETNCDKCGRSTWTNVMGGNMKVLCSTCQDKRQLNIRILIVLGVLAFASFWFWFPPYMEMRTFNKMTSGEKATFWDAVFSDLRVIAK